MKIKAAIISAMTVNLALSDDQIEKAATDFSLNVDSDYTNSDKEAVNAAAGQLLLGYLLLDSFSEGGVSVSFNHANVTKQITFLYQNSGGKLKLPAEMLPLQNKVKAVNRW